MPYFYAEFKREVIRLLFTSGRSATQLARELGRLKQDELKATAEIDGPGQALSAVVEQENRELRRELEATRRQRNLLPSAIAICSEDGLRADRVRSMK